MIEGLDESASMEIPPSKPARGVAARAGASRRGVARILGRWFPGGHTAPGRERIISSPLVIGLIVALVILIGMGFWLKSIIAMTMADRTFNRGEARNSRTAIIAPRSATLDTFMASNPEDNASRQGPGHAGAGQRPAVHLAERLDLDLGTGSGPCDVGAGRPGRRSSATSEWSWPSW